MSALGRLHCHLVVFAAFAVTRFAAGACPNPCEMTIEPPVVQPALACATVDAIKQSCDCALLFEVVNDCSTALEALDFEFGLCWATGSAQQPCTVLEPGFRGSLFLKLETVGAKTWAFQLSDGDVEHDVHLAANVSSMGSDGCGCVVVRSRDDGFGILLFQLLASAVVFRSRRRNLPLKT